MEYNTRPIRLIRAMGICVAVCAMLIVLACEKTPNPQAEPSPEEAAKTKAPLPNVDQRLCTGIVLLVDTSGSMGQGVNDQSGQLRSKSEIAKQAIDRIVAYTDQWIGKHPDRTIHFGIHTFSSSAHPLLKMDKFDRAIANAAVAKMPEPAGGTAIGSAIRSGFESLYQSGCVRKYVVCITDGENTSGPRPGYVARELYQQTQGDVEIHFVAFDTSAEHFDFLKNVNGTVVEAADGMQLDERLAEIYERRIFAEEMSLEAADSP